jgi:hypothetical protein
MAENSPRGIGQLPSHSDLRDTGHTGEKLDNAGADTQDKSASTPSGTSTEDGEHYASGIALVLIGIGVALSVFLVALVSDSDSLDMRYQEA